MLRLFYIRKQIVSMTERLRMDESMTTKEAQEVFRKLERRIQDRERAISVLVRGHTTERASPSSIDNSTIEQNTEVGMSGATSRLAWKEPEYQLEENYGTKAADADVLRRENLDIIDLTESNSSGINDSYTAGDAPSINEIRKAENAISKRTSCARTNSLKPNGKKIRKKSKPPLTLAVSDTPKKALTAFQWTMPAALRLNALSKSARHVSEQKRMNP